MASQRLARRYAKALIQLGTENKNLDSLEKDFKIVFNAFENSKELRTFCNNPIISRSKKKNILTSIFENNVSETVIKYLQGIVVNKREEYIYDIIKEFFLLRDEALGIIKVEVRTSTNFSDQQKQKLQSLLENLTKKTIQPSYNFDITLKGVFVLRIGDKMYDTSIKRQLEVLKNRFLQTELPLVTNM